ncbi:MAG: hypothetical protein JW874_02735 [Spirochaetales bacterium]|nr:hypothetical protein [Spirochaetales bacterium]
MTILYIILTIIAVTVSAISLIAYTSRHSNLQKGHRQIMAALAPARRLSPAEIEKFRLLYKKKIPENDSLSVYRHEGIIEYISIKVQGSEVKEYTLGGVKVSTYAVQKLEKKAFKYNFTELAREAAQETKKRIEAILAEYKDNGRSEVERSELAEKVKAAMSDLNCSAEIVFLKNDIRKQGFPVAFNDWKLIDYDPEKKE